MYKETTELAKKVDDILSDYVLIHNDTIEHRKVFVPINFDKKYDDLWDCIQRLRKSIKEIKEYNVKLDKDFSDKQFMGLLQTYADILFNTFGLLLKIIGGLKDKANNEGSYGWLQYRKDLKIYNESVKLYAEVGQNLNKSYS